MTRTKRGGLETRQLEVCGQSFRIATRAGTGPTPPLLVMNGSRCSMEVIQPFLDALDPTTGYVCFDAPGIGGSPRPRRPYRLTGLSQRIGAILGQLEITEVDVLGVSWGGALAQQFAVTHPRTCRRLFLVSTAAGPFVKPSLSTFREAVAPRRFDAERGRDIAVRLYGGKVRTDPDLLSVFAPQVKNDGGERYQILSMLGWTSLPFIRLIRQPTLVLHGDDDQLVPVFNAHLLVRLLPHAELSIFADGHLGFVTSAPEVAGAVEEFRRRTTTGTAAA